MHIGYIVFVCSIAAFTFLFALSVFLEWFLLRRVFKGKSPYRIYPNRGSLVWVRTFDKPEPKWAKAIIKDVFDPSKDEYCVVIAIDPFKRHDDLLMPTVVQSGETATVFSTRVYSDAHFDEIMEPKVGATLAL